MGKTVLFRDFEERDIDFIYKCKNDEKLNSMIVGQFKPFTYEDAVKWIHGCMGEHETFKFWAICTNDEEKRIIGWVSIANIDRDNSSASFHGIVIGDSEYKTGFAWIEAYLFIFNYIFDVLNLHRLNDTCLTEHKSTTIINPVMYLQLEGIERDAIFKDNRFYDKSLYGILKEEYINHLNNGDYDMKSIISRFIAAIKKKK